MLRLAFDFIITWRETRTRPNAYVIFIGYLLMSFQPGFCFSSGFISISFRGIG